jgi:hypothetical protein
MSQNILFLLEIFDTITLDGFVESRLVETGVQDIYKHLNPALSGTGFRRLARTRSGVRQE